MRLRTFNAPDMPTAMRMVRETLGDSAIILASNSQSKGVTVTAAIDGLRDETPPPPKPAAKPVAKAPHPETDKLRFEIQSILRFHNLPDLFMAKLMQHASDDALSAILALHQVSAHRETRPLVKTALEKLLGAYFMFEPLSWETHNRLMLVGPPGVGKTLTIARIATQLAMDKQPLAVITTDTKRAGGVEQLQAFTRILDIDLQVAGSRAELWKKLQSLPARSRVLVDTAGCNAYEKDELQDLKNATPPEGIEPILVLPAGGDSMEAIDITEAFVGALPIRRLLVTRADTARRMGSVMAAAAACGLAFCNTTLSASIVDALQPLDARTLAQMLLRYKT